MLNFYIVKNHFLQKHVKYVKNLIEVLKTEKFDDFFDLWIFRKNQFFECWMEFFDKFCYKKIFWVLRNIIKKISKFFSKMIFRFSIFNIFDSKNLYRYILVQIKSWTSRNSSFCPSKHALKLFQLPLFKKNYWIVEKT